MCGEHFIISARGLGKTGSSPHVRGALSQLQCPCRWLGIIPACAGSTCPSRPSAATAGDHPRMCGEHRICCQSCKISTGSSPHVRGALVQDFLQGLSTGIIPACAGSTVSWRIRRPPCRDHPRMCGEHNRGSSFGQSHKGSSPHVRGARQACDDALQESGIIPACAGSTGVGKTKLLFIWDHPRMCGEHELGDFAAFLDQGSSPHVRGALRQTQRQGQRPGIIPACAGSTPTATRPSREPRDHPRMCGEHLPDVSLAVPLPGSSPHVRGARPCLPLVAEPCGIIPACAGSTVGR